LDVAPWHYQLQVDARWSVNEVEARLFTTIIRGMIWHAKDVTNHRVMQLLLGTLGLPWVWAQEQDERTEV